MIFRLIIGFGIGIGLSGWSYADISLEQAMRSELAKKFAHAQIELNTPSLGGGLSITDSVRSATLISESRGIADFVVMTKAGHRQVAQIAFSAMVPAFIANSRVRPGEKLSASNFKLQQINVAHGLAYEYRGLMLSPETNLDQFEARQTILEGQYPLSSGIQKIPDIRRGDSVRVQLMSGDIQLTTQGTAQEPAYLNGAVRVLTNKTKKELIGKALDNGVVEVRL